MLKHGMRAVNSINYNNQQHVRTAQTPPIGQHPRTGIQRTNAKAIIRQPTGDESVQSMHIYMLYVYV